MRFALWLMLAACSEGPVEIAGQISAIGGDVPLSSTCNEGAGALSCATVPPVFARAWTTDAVASPGEYYGAVEFTYRKVSDPSRRNGKIRVAFDGNKNKLRVFLAQVPVIIDDAVKLSVFVDLDRFAEGAPVGEEDRRYTVDVDTGATEVALGGSTWSPGEVSEPWSIAFNCVPSGVALRSCDVEYEIGLPQWALKPPTPDDLPGIGFAVLESDSLTGGFPPELANAMDADETLDRLTYQTLLIGQPEGVPVSFASFNLRLWGDEPGTARFSSNLMDFATVIARYDVVVVQELWKQSDADAILALVNGIRAGAGVPAMKMYGPPSADPAIIGAIEMALIDIHGGIYVFTRFPAIGTGYDAFDDCRGEDCIKAKGVYWTRLALNSVAETVVSADCMERVPGKSCDTPTDEMFLDVFALHTQGPKPVLCQDIPAFTALLSVVLNAPWIAGLYDVAFFCESHTDDSARQAQLTEARGFIDAIMASAPGRQAIIAGDLNVDGQFLQNDGSTEYGRMLTLLGLLAPGASSSAAEPDDTLHTATGDFAWDLDRSDLARDMISDWVTGFGTEIGPVDPSDPLPVLPDRDGDLVPDGDARLDYILVRPSNDALPSGYILARSTGPLFRAVWPDVFTMPAAGPPTQLSDHMLVESFFQVVPMRYPGRYDPQVPHDFRLTVASIDVTGDSDCWLGLCNPVDPFVKIGTGVFDFTGALTSSADIEGTECHGWSLIRGVDPCMDDWLMVTPQALATDAVHRGTVVPFEQSDVWGSSSYAVTVNPVGDPQLRFTWATGLLEGIEIFSHLPLGPPFWPIDPLVITTEDPFRWCSSDRPFNVCLELALDEKDP